MEPGAQPRSRTFIAVLAALLTFGALFAVSADAFVVEKDIVYHSGAEGSPDLKKLDVYRPDDARRGDLRPVVVYVHGGAWMNGDKSNRMEYKPDLFTSAGYVFVSVNYRLSPEVTSTDPDQFDPGRLRFPEHPGDVAESIAWVSRNIGARGGDPDAIMLLGHSAGAHLVSLVATNPVYLDNRGASAEQVLGVVSLDAGALNVAESAIQAGAQPTVNNLLIWNAFGTPAENALRGDWVDASPVNWADSSDPRHLLVTQADRLLRVHDNRLMAGALGQDPLGVFESPLDHEGINTVLGDPVDTTGETAAVMGFIADRRAGRINPAIAIRKRPAKKVRIGSRAKKRKVVFKFTARGVAAGIQCRLDRAKFSRCSSPHSFRVKPGGHTFRLRSLYPSGRPGKVKVVKFKVVRNKRHHRR
ncbi:MAG: alpha/beta hydrolase [Solirubrobacterales bacterium]